MLNKLLGLLLLGATVVWLLRLIVDEGVIRHSPPLLVPLNDVARLLVGWTLVVVVLLGLWAAARFNAGRHGSMDQMGPPPPLVRLSWRQWWTDRPGPLSATFWSRSTGERREARDMSQLLVVWLICAAGLSVLSVMEDGDLEEWELGGPILIVCQIAVAAMALLG